MENKKDPWTLQQKFGFQDNDLKSPKHDDIMVWLDTNIEKILQDRLYKLFLGEWRDSVIWAEKHYVGEVNYNKDVLPSKLEIIEKIWEKPITNKNYTIGFIDFGIRVKYPVLYTSTTSYGLHIDYDENKGKIAFEVKTTIPSLGELIRQIRMYQTYIDCPFFVVAPDDKYEQVLKSQNIGFIKYTG